MPIKNFSGNFFFDSLLNMDTWAWFRERQSSLILVREHATTVEPLLQNTVMITQNVTLSNGSQKQIMDLALICLSGTGPWIIQTSWYVPLAFLKVSFVK